ncbi:MAG TPA: DUF2721 domain-containing protein [Candidatus Polarisedimenticolia bacterium]|jgi:hypothetical protein|nr:DUF2721 domain-containing protein [Candidatus Polarisedimenticolia bacterium]
MDEQTAITTVGHAIQFSVAPVFLLSAIGAMLAVLTGRLARIVERARVCEVRLGTVTPEEIGGVHGELNVLARRARLVNRAITFCTITALLVCGVVATLFLGVFFRFPVALPVAGLFVTAMSMFIAGLLYFLREIFIATANLPFAQR